MAMMKLSRLIREASFREMIFLLIRKAVEM